MPKIAIAILLGALLAAAASSPPPPTATSQRNSNAGHRGTEQKPVIVKVVLPEKPKADVAKEDAKEKKALAVEQRLADLTGDLARYTEGLFVATAILATLTAGLLVLGFLQIRDAKKSIAAAAAAAEAAKDQVALGRDEFNATHRPKIKIRAVGFSAELTNEDQFAVKFTCINTGDSPCEIYNVRSRFDPAEKADAPLYRMNMDIIELPKAVALAPGEPISFTTKILTKDEGKALGFDWDIYGFVWYKDGSGVKRVTGFWRRYRPSTETWRAPENPDYNYEY